MKHGFLKVAACAPRVFLGNPKKNADEILKVAEDVAKQGASLAVFPELCITGYSLGDLFFQRTLRDSALDGLDAIRRGSKKLDMALVVGLPLELSGALYNCAAVIAGGEICGIVPKQYLSAQESRVFSSGVDISASVVFGNSEAPLSANLLFEIDGANAAIELGSEAFLPTAPAFDHSLAGAEFIVNPAAIVGQVTRSSYIRETVKNTSARLLCGYLYAGAGEGESTTDGVYGKQLLVCEDGDVLSYSHQILNQSTDYIITDLDMDRIRAERMQTHLNRLSDTHRVIQIDITGKDLALSRKISPSPFLPECETARNARFAEIFDIQAAALKARLTCVHTDKAVVAVSGGLDSTLALLVTVRALDAMGAPRSNLTAVTMPGFGTSGRTYENAMNLMKNLGLTVREISIKDACVQHFDDIGHDLSNHNAVYENAQARERTQIAMDIANQLGGIHVGTGDLSELCLGFATYGGDHMSMYGVNASIPKTLMQHMVVYAANLPEFASVKSTLIDIVETPISPELLPLKDGELTQKTEGIVGPYELHDFFLFYLLRYGYSPKKLHFLACHAFEGTYSSDTIKAWLILFLKRFFAQQFKRSCLPDGPAVGSVSISPRGGWMVPTDAQASAWLEEVEEI